MAKPGQREAAVIRRQRALDLKIAGARYRQIGKELGVSHVQAYRDVQESLAELDVITKQKAERFRDLELERLERMTLGLWPKVRLGDEKAIRTLVAVSDRRAKLLGLDAPQRVDATSGGAPMAFTLTLTRPTTNVFST